MKHYSFSVPDHCDLAFREWLIRQWQYLCPLVRYVAGYHGSENPDFLVLPKDDPDFVGRIIRGEQFKEI